MLDEKLISVPECTNLIDNLVVIVNFAKLNEDKTKIINAKKVRIKTAVNYFFDDRTQITQECLRFYDKLDLFAMDREDILIKENGKILLKNPHNIDLWFVPISQKLWELYEPQIKAVFTVIEKIQNEGKELYKNKIKKRFYEEFRAQPLFLVKGKERSESNMNHKSNNILSFLSKIKVLNIKRFKGQAHLIQINIENLTKFFPKLNYGIKDESLDPQEEIWDYSTFIQIILEIFSKLPSAGDWNSVKGVDYYKLRENSIIILSKKKRIQNQISTYNDLLNDINKTYRTDFTITTYLDNRKIVRIKNPTYDNFSRKIPRRFK